MAQGMQGEFYVCYVDTGRSFASDDSKTLAENIRFAENLGARVAKIKGKTVAEAVAEFARENHITQVYLAARRGPVGSGTCICRPYSGFWRTLPQSMSTS